MVSYGDKWDKVVFSDEKKFNLDGSDGLQYYWHDLRKEKETYFSRQSGGGSVMIWGGFLAGGATELAILDGKQDSGKYIFTLCEYLLPFSHRLYRCNLFFSKTMPPFTPLV